MIIAGYSPNRNWWNLIRTTSRSSATRQAKKIGIGLTNFAQLTWKKRGGFKKNLDSFHQASWNFVGISTVVRGSLGVGWKNTKWWQMLW
jgi:hypothetical protein